MSAFHQFVATKGLKPEGLTSEQENGMMQAFLSEIAQKAEKAGVLEQKLQDLHGDYLAQGQKHQKQIEDLMAKMADLKAGAGQFFGTKSFRGRLFEELASRTVELKNAIANRGEMSFKANFLRASVTDNNLGQYLQGVGQLATRNLTIYDALNKISMPGNADNGRVRYFDWVQATTVRNAAMTAEAAAFAEATAIFQEYNEQLRKVGNSIPYSDESDMDIQFLVDELERFLMNNLMLTINQQLVNGNNTGQQLNGMINVVPTFTASSQGVVQPNTYDLLVSMQTAINIAAGSKGAPDVVFMNPIDVDRLRRTKATDGQYIIPPYAASPILVSGMTIIPSADVVQNTLFMGVGRLASVYEKDGFGIEFGYVNTDFNDGLKRMRVFKRLLFLIRTVDRTSFSRVTNITTSIAALA